MYVENSFRKDKFYLFFSLTQAIWAVLHGYVKIWQVLAVISDTAFDSHKQAVEMQTDEIMQGLKDIDVMYYGDVIDVIWVDRENVKHIINALCKRMVQPRTNQCIRTSRNVAWSEVGQVGMAWGHYGFPAKYKKWYVD